MVLPDPRKDIKRSIWRTLLMLRMKAIKSSKGIIVGSKPGRCYHRKDDLVYDLDVISWKNRWKNLAGIELGVSTRAEQGEKKHGQTLLHRQPLPRERKTVCKISSRSLGWGKQSPLVSGRDIPRRGLSKAKGQLGGEFCPYPQNGSYPLEAGNLKKTEHSGERPFGNEEFRST